VTKDASTRDGRLHVLLSNDSVHWLSRFLNEDWRRRAKRLLAEPTLHFFLIGALLFGLERRLNPDERTIVVAPGVKSALVRNFRDMNGRSPSTEELDAAFVTWKRDEALYREALREGLERDDPMIRAALAGKMRRRAALEAPKRQPSDAELAAWLAAHPELYSMPVRYDYEYVAFPKSQANAQEKRAEFERALRSGEDPARLGRSILGGNLTAEELAERLGPTLAERIRSLPPRTWLPLENDESFLLARLNRSAGGLPKLEEVRPRLISDWMDAMEREAVERATRAIAESYHFEEEP
jgi:hypothetical protein